MSQPEPLSEATAGRDPALGPTFDCLATHDDTDVVRIHLTGELDLATTPQLEHALSAPEALRPVVVLDLRKLTFIDSRAIHAIVNATGRARREGRRLVVEHVPPHVDRILTLTGAIDHIELGVKDRAS